MNSVRKIQTSMKIEQSVNDKIELFINEKIEQIKCYFNAVKEQKITSTELDYFVDNTMAEWTLLNVTDEQPDSLKEKVFWHVIFEFNLNNTHKIFTDNELLNDLQACFAYLSGLGNMPKHCVGWRPLP